MTELFASVAGHRVTKTRVSIPPIGPWFADLDLDEVVPLAGRVAVQVGNVALSGTVAPASGSFGQATKVRIIAGAGGWGTLLPAKGYHNDAGVKALTVATDAAREAGETLGVFSPPRDRVGADYVRRAGPASLVLEDVLGGVPWWVDYAGLTQARPRPSAPAGVYELLEFDPRNKLAILAPDDLAAVGIGSVLSERLDAPETVRELEIVIADGSLRVKAWCGQDDASSVAGLLATIARQATGGKLWGKYRYRVVTMAGDGRVNLQAVSRAVGLPDVLPVRQKPGIAGAHAELTPGAEVLVEFIAGEATDPIVTGFGGKGEPGCVPVLLSLAGGMSPVARVGDTVNVFFPPSIPFTGTVAGAPAVGLLTVLNPGVGIIQSGAPRVLA